jgi:hypothetical protein
MDNKNRLLIRDIVYCKPGKVRPMVEKFLEVAKLYEELGLAFNPSNLLRWGVKEPSCSSLPWLASALAADW